MKSFLAVAAGIAVLGAGVEAGPARAGSSKCWFQMKPNASSLDPVPCRVSERTNSNGHRVYDVIESDGYTRTVVLWDSARAEILVEGKNLKGDWKLDQDGDVRISMDAGGDWAFKAKNISAISTGRPTTKSSSPSLVRTVSSVSTVNQPVAAQGSRHQRDSLNLASVVAAWENNQVAAMRRFNGRSVVINGYVDGIYENRIEVHQSGVTSSVSCYYNNSDRVARLNHREAVSVTGTLSLESGWFGGKSMSIKNCTIS